MDALEVNDISHWDLNLVTSYKSSHSFYHLSQALRDLVLLVLEKEY